MEPRNSPNIEQRLASLCERHADESRRLLQILIEVQEIYRFIPPEAITFIAKRLSLPRVAVEGAAGFYSFLSLEPAGEYRVLFSDNVTDQMLGNQELMRQFCNKLWLEPGKVSEDQLVSTISLPALECVTKDRQPWSTGGRSPT